MWNRWTDTGQHLWRPSIRGHPIGATGIAQLHELALQLRGEARERQVEGARLAIAENGGGLYGIEEASVAVTILGAKK